MTRSRKFECLAAGTMLLCVASVGATPANKAALDRYYDKFLSTDLNRCTTCHLPSANKSPETLDEFPHNPFGARLRALGKELARAGKPKELALRLPLVAKDDSDGDGVSNEVELLLGHNPGDPKDTPSKKELGQLKMKQKEFSRYLASYRWRPLDRVERPPVPKVKNARWVQNPIDAFVATEHERRGLQPRPEASKSILLRRVYLDLIGLSPTPAEQDAFENDHGSNAYEKLVDRLLQDPRYGERWGRHWMDVWRYSDWAGWSGGNQIRDSKPHIWRWRDWIIESLNDDKGYDRMVVEMLAADELCPEDENALRATGFLVRNYKMLSREQWLEDTVKHTAQAFLGTTVGCCKCHNHMTEPITQKEYYQFRAIFEPHQVRTDRLPGELDTGKLGLVRAYDVGTNPPTWFFNRGDERSPDTNRLMQPAVPRAMCGPKLNPDLGIAPVALPRLAAHPDERAFVIQDTITASEKSVETARKALTKTGEDRSTNATQLSGLQLSFALAEASHAELLAVLKAESLDQRKDGAAWETAAKDAARKQREVGFADASLKLHQARIAESEARKKVAEAVQNTNETNTVTATTVKKEKSKKDSGEKLRKDLEAAEKKTVEAEKTLAEAEKNRGAALTTAYKPRAVETYPDTSTGRRLAFAKWVANPDNPLTARVAINHFWLRHFGRGIVPTPADFGRNGAPASNPALLDWLASEFMSRHWSMKAMHKLILTSSTYRMASASDPANAKIDPDNVYLWRGPSRRMEAEAVRDNLLYVTGSLDPAMGGPDIDNALGLSSRRRSVYLRQAAEKEVEFLRIFDGPSVTECYQRRPTVMPQQALALANSELAIAQAKLLAKKLRATFGNSEEAYVENAFKHILARPPGREELRVCSEFISGQETQAASAPPLIAVATAGPGLDTAAKKREHLILVLLNHNDFVTIR